MEQYPCRPEAGSELEVFQKWIQNFSWENGERTKNGGGRRSIEKLCGPQQSPDSLWAVLPGPWRLSYHVSMYVNPDPDFKHSANPESDILLSANPDHDF